MGAIKGEKKRKDQKVEQESEKEKEAVSRKMNEQRKNPGSTHL